MNILQPVDSSNSTKPKKVDHQCGLLRLFQSPLFDMHMAIQYLTKCQEHGIQTFIINKFFSYPTEDVDLYLPQLVCLLVVSPQISEALFAYFQYRSQNSIEYTMLLVWLLNSYTDHITAPTLQSSVSFATLPSQSRPLPPQNSDSSNNNLEPSLSNHKINDTSPPRTVVCNNGSLLTGELSHSDRLIAFKESLVNGCCSSFQNSNGSHFNLNPTGSMNSTKNPVDFIDHKEFHKIYSIDDFSKLYRIHKRSVSDMTSNDVKRHYSNFDNMESADEPELKNGFYFNDNNDSDDLNCHNHLSAESKSSLTSQSFNSLPDLLSGHAFDNVCNNCQNQAVKRPNTFLTSKSTLSLPNTVNSRKLSNSKSTSSNIQTKDDCRIDTEQFLSMDLSAANNTDHDTNIDYNLPCNCMNYYVEPQSNFIKTLVSISKRLTRFPSKEQKTNYLRADLAHLNLNLPARVWIPIYGANHYVVRIPPNAAVCLNSKTRAPYLIYVEIVKTSNPFTDDIIQKNLTSSNLEKTPSCSSLTEIDCSIPNLLAKNSISCSDSHTSANQDAEVYIAAGDIRKRLSENISAIAKQEISNFNDDPSASVLFELWNNKKQRIRESSPYGRIDDWDLLPVIVKHGDDLRQEQLAYQVLKVLQKIWTEEHCSLWLRPLTIVVLSSESGMIEPILDAVSIHQIKRIHAGKSLADYFKLQFGLTNSETYLEAQKNFVHSLAAYCLVCYLLQVKDRHNGNILLDNEGHIIHIDYGFILSASPGRNLGFEFSPFKLTYEDVEIMGGLQSDMFEYFKILLLQGLLTARKHMDRILSIIEVLESVAPKFPCFSKGFETVYSNFRDRFYLNRTEEQLQTIVENLVENSLHSLTTKLYDSFQYYTNGIR